MKRIKKRIFCIILVFICIYQPMVVFASNADHGGGGGSHTSYEGDYTIVDFLNERAELYAFAWAEVSKLFIFVTSTTYGVISGASYEDIAKGFVTYSDSLLTGEWIHVDANNNVTYDQELIDLLKQFLEEYAQQYPDEVEKVEYQLFQTSTYEELFADYIDIKNAFSIYVPLDVPSDLNSLENFRTMLKSQDKEFPHLMRGMVFNTQIDQNRAQGDINQNFMMYQNYEAALTDPTKTPCFIGSWDVDGAYRLGIYIYDSTTKSITVDRTLSSTQQYHYVWSDASLDSGFKLTGTYKGLFDSSGNAYVNMTDGYFNGWGNLPDATLYPELRERYKADFSGETVKLPILGTPDGSVFRLFATEQDALRFFEGCADSGLNFDPNQVYTGGNITINNNGDVIINNGPGGGEDDPDGDSSGILGVLKDIRDWVKKIYNQVVIGNVINAIDALANVLDTLKNYLDEVAGDAAAIAELGEELVTKFPFSLPRDILLVVTLFEAEPVAPVWEIPFRADFGGPTGIKIGESFTIDFTDFKDAVDVLKWFLSLVWIFGLAMLTPKVLGIGGIGNSKGD